ncbi:MAG: CRISPR-associated endonuclease Cas1 [Candidatus Lokiarchaeota archaeon]|nr:CRISPR-associated endonuclease Cas1 [Candidatus Lokiarchaeota archaeon]
MQKTLYITSSKFELKKENDTIKYERADPDNAGKNITQVIPVMQLASIETYGNVKISTPLLKLCNELGIPCFFNTYRGHPIGKFVPERPKPSIVRLKQFETHLDEERKLHIAKAIVRKACEERIKLVNKYDEKGSLKKITGEISSFLKKTASAKTTNQLRGFEGNAMKAFFEAFSKILKHLSFNGRSTQPPKDEANALISFGNVMLYNKVRAVLYRTSLDPLVGFLHEPHENRNSLALDMAEIFRPITVDATILMLDRKRNITSEHFKHDKIKCLLNPAGKHIWIETFRNKLESSFDYKPLKRKVSIQEQIKIECFNLIKYFNREKSNYAPIEFNTL